MTDAEPPLRRDLHDERTPSSSAGATSESPQSHPLLQLLPIMHFEPYVDHESPEPSTTISTPYTCPRSLNTVVRMGRAGEQAKDSNVLYILVRSKVVSRSHCEIWYTSGQWYIRDVGSSSGTFLNGARLPLPYRDLPPLAVKDGDIVQLGTNYSQGEDPRLRRVTFKLRCTGARGRLLLFENVQRLRAQMLANGWCSHRIDYLAKYHGLDMFAYLSGLQPLRRRDHGRCKDQPSCVAYNVNPATYKTQHVTADCSCAFVGPSYDEVKRIAAGGGVPLLDIQQGSDSAFTIRVSERKPLSQYVALTHVWADGLGNPSECALPICQIRKLKAALSKLDSTRSLSRTLNRRSLFWMDTLCIPVKDEDLAVRLVQIDKMASIYKAAWTCLVLDSELMTLVPSDLHVFSEETVDGRALAKLRTPHYHLSQETYARIVTSVWMRYAS